MMTQFQKYRTALRYYLLGKEAHRALRAMEFASFYHAGTRKDGVTPEFQHQIEIVNYLCTLPLGELIEDIAIVAFLHDVMEDYNVSYRAIADIWGHEIAQHALALNKNGKTTDEYYGSLALSPITSIVKGADRIHNLRTMVGVFTPEKQLKYVEETEAHVLPMLKEARRLHPEHTMAYENIKHVLTLEVSLIRALNTAQP